MSGIAKKLQLTSGEIMFDEHMLPVAEFNPKVAVGTVFAVVRRYNSHDELLRAAKALLPLVEPFNGPLLSDEVEALRVAIAKAEVKP